MAAHGVGNVDLAKAYAQLIAQDLGIAACAFGGAEAGHGNGQNILGIAVQNAHGAHSHQQRQAGIQAAADADHRRFGPGVFKALGKAVGLHFQNQLAAFGTAGSIGRNKGCCGHRAGERNLHGIKIKLDHIIAGIIGGKGGVVHTLAPKALHIQLAFGIAGGEGGAFGQHRAVFGHNVVCAKHHVSGAFTVTGVGVNIAAQQAGRLVGNQLTAVFGLGYGFIAGRAVGDHGSARQCVAAAGRHRGPHILADLHTQHKGGHLAAAEQNIGAKGHFKPGTGYKAGGFGGGSELTTLVKFAVVGKICFGNQAQQLTAANNGGTVVKLAVYRKGKAHHGHLIQPLAGGDHLFQRRLSALQQGVLQKQIAAGVAGKRKFGENQQLHIGVGLHGFYDFFGIVVAVCHAQSRRAGSGFDKSVLHVPFLAVFFK